MPEPLLSKAQWNALEHLYYGVGLGDGIVHTTLKKLAKYGLIELISYAPYLLEAGELYFEANKQFYEELFARPKEKNVREIVKWQPIWTALSEPCQEMIDHLYRRDQHAEKDQKRRYIYGGRPQPASEWRWLYFSLYEDMSVYETDAGVIHSELEKQGYLECRIKRSDAAGGWRVFIKLTPKARKLVRYGKPS